MGEEFVGPFFQFTGKLVEFVFFHQVVDALWSDQVSVFFQFLVVGKTTRQAVWYHLTIIEHDIDVGKGARSHTLAIADRVGARPIAADAVNRVPDGGILEV